MDRFESFSLSTELFSNATRFITMISELSTDDFTNAGNKIRGLLRQLNDFSILRGSTVKISSPKHLIDWSYGEADPAVTIEEAYGSLQGRFIGYQVMPDEDPDSGEQIPVLAAVMDTTIDDPDIGPVQVFVVSPIYSSVIELQEA